MMYHPKMTDRSPDCVESNSVHCICGSELYDKMENGIKMIEHPEKSGGDDPWFPQCRLAKSPAKDCPAADDGFWNIEF